jgi:hypothetical protein
MGPVKKMKKGGSFKDKFKQNGKTPVITPTQVWTDKYGLLLKSNGCRGEGESDLKNNKLHDVCLHTLSVEFMINVLINVCLPSSLPPSSRRE